VTTLASTEGKSLSLMKFSIPLLAFVIFNISRSSCFSPPLTLSWEVQNAYSQEVVDRLNPRRGVQLRIPANLRTEVVSVTASQVRESCDLPSFEDELPRPSDSDFSLLRFLAHWLGAGGNQQGDV
jgi:hypothetical protein